MPFRKSDRIRLWREAGFRCAAPDCGQLLDMPGVKTIGDAAHIFGENPNSARYDSPKAPENRNALENGIFLCPSCHRKIDTDVSAYPPAILKKWKSGASTKTLEELTLGRRLAVLGAVNILDERERARKYLTNQLHLRNMIAELFSNHSHAPKNIVSDFLKLMELNFAISRAINGMYPFGINRSKEYCYSTPCRGRQFEMERMLKILRQSIPMTGHFILDLEREELAGPYIPGHSSMGSPTTSQGSALLRYREQYDEFDEYLDNALNWSGASV